MQATIGITFEWAKSPNHEPSCSDSIQSLRRVRGSLVCSVIAHTWTSRSSCLLPSSPVEADGGSCVGLSWPLTGTVIAGYAPVGRFESERLWAPDVLLRRIPG